MGASDRDQSRPRRVKVLGERNCGTNLLAQLFALNTDLAVLSGSAPLLVRKAVYRFPKPAAEATLDLWHAAASSWTLGWKHAYVTERVARRLRRSDTLGVVVVKHPLSWLTSLRRHAYHIDRGNAGLQARRLRREHLPQQPNDLRDVWPIKHRRYVDLADAGVVRLVRFEDLMVDPAATFAELLAATGVAENASVQVPQRDVKGSARTAADIADFYRHERWRAEVEPGDEEWFQGIDPDLLGRLGYR